MKEGISTWSLRDRRTREDMVWVEDTGTTLTSRTTIRAFTRRQMRGTFDLRCHTGDRMEDMDMVDRTVVVWQCLWRVACSAVRFWEDFFSRKR